METNRQRIVCIRSYYPPGNQDGKRYAVFETPGFQNLEDDLDRLDAFRTARKWFDEDESLCVIDHTPDRLVGVATREPGRMEELRLHLAKLDLRVEPLEWPDFGINN